VNKLPRVILVAVLFLALAAISLILVALPGLEGDIKGVLAFLAGTATLGLSSALAQLTKRDPLPPPALTFNLRFYTGALDRALAASEETVTKRIESALQNQLADVETGLADRLRQRVVKDVSDTFRTLQLEAAVVARLAEPAAPARLGAEQRETRLHPRAPQVIRWIARNERKYAFFSVKFLRDKVFGADPDDREGLQFCIDKGLLELYDQPNPKDAQHPTTACRLNRDSALTLEILR